MFKNINIANCGSDEEETSKMPNKSEIREKSIVFNNSGDGRYLVRRSLQDLSIADNLQHLANKVWSLENWRDSQSAKVLSKIDKHRVLLELFKYLIATEQPLTFSEAFEIYDGYQTFSRQLTAGKVEFHDNLMHPVDGLRVYISFIPSVEHLIFLRPDTPTNIEPMLKRLFDRAVFQSGDGQKCEKFHLISSNTSVILKCMDTEWDRKCARVLLSANRSNAELESLGKDAYKTRCVETVKQGVEESENALKAAEDMVKLRLKAKTDASQERAKTLSELRDKNANKWSDQFRLSEIDDMISKEEEKVRNVDLLLNDEKKEQFRSMCKSTAKGLIEENRIKRRRLGAGPSEKIDEECELFMAKAIESKATYHGRRPDTVMYTNRRVKRRDLLDIANFNLVGRGKKPIKSAVTAWNRSQPKIKISGVFKVSVTEEVVFFVPKSPPKPKTNTMKIHTTNGRV